MFNEWTKDRNFNYCSDIDTSKNGIRNAAEETRTGSGYSKDQKDLIVNSTLTLHYSYDTVVAFRTPSTGLVISKNAWSRTTGKHLNYIDRDKSKRIPEKEFEEKLIQVLDQYNLIK